MTSPRPSPSPPSAPPASVATAAAAAAARENDNDNEGDDDESASSTLSLLSSCWETVTSENQPLLSLTIPGDQGVGWMAMGCLGEVHDLFLRQKQERQEQQSRTTTGSNPPIRQEEEEEERKETGSEDDKNDDEDERAPRTMLLRGKIPAPNKDSYDYMRQHGAWPPADFNKTRWIPAAAGTWRMARLLCPQGNSNPNSNSNSNINETMNMCGAVLWSEEAFRDESDTSSSTTRVTTSAQQVAAILQRDIVGTRVHMYNCNEETDAFLAIGGRILGRMYWDSSSSNWTANNSLADTSPDKLNVEHLESYNPGDFFGPDLLVCPVHNNNNDDDNDTYWQYVWPVLQSQPRYGRTVDHATLTCIHPAAAAYAFFSQQEYLAGRMLTKEMIVTTAATTADASASSSPDTTNEDNNNNNNKREKRVCRVMTLLLLFTYAAPESLEDAWVENVLIRTAIGGGGGGGGGGNVGVHE